MSLALIDKESVGTFCYMIMRCSWLLIGELTFGQVAAYAVNWPSSTGHLVLSVNHSLMKAVVGHRNLRLSCDLPSIFMNNELYYSILRLLHWI